MSTAASRLLIAGAISGLVVFSAAAEPMLQRGDQELTLHISPDFESAIGDNLYAEAGYGLFVRDRLAARVTASYRLMEDVAGEEADYRLSSFDLIGEYQIPLGARFVPFIAAGVGVARSHFGKLEESATVYGPRTGLKVFLADNVCLALEVAYRRATSKVFINDFEAEDADIGSSVGIRIQF